MLSRHINSFTAPSLRSPMSFLKGLTMLDQLSKIDTRKPGRKVRMKGMPREQAIITMTRVGRAILCQMI